MLVKKVHALNEIRIKVKGSWMIVGFNPNFVIIKITVKIDFHQ